MLFLNVEQEILKIIHQLYLNYAVQYINHEDYNIKQYSWNKLKLLVHMHYKSFFNYWSLTSFSGCRMNMWN